MKFLPISINVSSKKCLVIGGGLIAYRKMSYLLEANANITVIADEFCTEVTKLINDELIDSLNCKFSLDLVNLKDYLLIILATNDKQMNQQIYSKVPAWVLVNAVDDVNNCDFITPAIVKREPLYIAITSDSKAPLITSFLAHKIELLIPNKFGFLADLVSKFRANLVNAINNIGERRRFWYKFLTKSTQELVFQGKINKVETLLQEEIEQLKVNETNDKPAKGFVYLVGAGPGDPELLTIKALRLIKQADVVLYDRLVSDDIIKLIRKDAQIIYVGKKVNNCLNSQFAINQKLIEFANKGKFVVRLKGGDPAIFSRVGEEIESLSKACIDMEIIPGVTAASACAAYAGIPLTHRNLSHSVIFISGHNKKGEDLDLDCYNLTGINKQTIVVYMAKAQINNICEQLIKKGASTQLPVALIENVTLANQRLLITNLDSIQELDQQSIQSPCLLIIGHVVSSYRKE